MPNRSLGGIGIDHPSFMGGSNPTTVEHTPSGGPPHKADRKVTAQGPAPSSMQIPEGSHVAPEGGISRDPGGDVVYPYEPTKEVTMTGASRPGMEGFDSGFHAARSRARVGESGNVAQDVAAVNVKTGTDYVPKTMVSYAGENKEIPLGTKPLPSDLAEMRVNKNPNTNEFAALRPDEVPSQVPGATGGPNTPMPGMPSPDYTPDKSKKP